jgi:Leucine-rich repeat (LRR) protein
LTEIDISSNKLTQLPSGIYDLPKLKGIFNASDNLLNEISPDIKNLKNIKILDLSNNLLDQVPEEELGALYSLEELYLQYNKLDRFECSSGGSPSLLVLDLSNNELSKVLFYGMSSLNILNLSNNRLMSYLKTDLNFEGLLSLKELNLSKNNLNALIDNRLMVLNSLEKLNLSENRIYHIPVQLKDLPILKALDLSNMDKRDLYGTILHIQSNTEGFKALQTLNLSNNWLAPIPGIKHFENLKTLKLNYCQLGNFPEAITELTNLTHLEINKNNFTEIPEQFKISSGFPTWIYL